MNDTKNQTPENPRKAIREARERRLRVIQGEQSAPTIKVYAANEDMRRVLKHSNGTGFRGELGEAAEWPSDNFTARRIAEGSVRTDGPGSGDATVPDPTQNPREQSAVSRKAAQPKSEVKSKSPPPPHSAA